ncbi:MAG TPA: MarR family transcriptional regulator [Candidatus Dormibacteraeota bacterium]|jgi:DNA-binding MarR family transcriptional regulator|nr:MarR family transcriptional regulator [Candidatus Dormibacteraeota bacterium]
MPDPVPSSPTPDAAGLDPLAVANRLRPVLLHISRHMRREIDSLGVTPGQLSLLGAVRDRPGIGISDLATRERTSAPTICAHIDRLEAGGLVARTRGEVPDRRRVGLSITDEGARVLLAARSLRTAWLATRLRALSDEQLRLVGEAIEPLSLLLEVPAPARSRGGEAAALAR